MANKTEKNERNRNNKNIEFLCKHRTEEKKETVKRRKKHIRSRKAYNHNFNVFRWKVSKSDDDDDENWRFMLCLCSQSISITALKIIKSVMRVAIVSAVKNGFVIRPQVESLPTLKFVSCCHFELSHLTSRMIGRVKKSSRSSSKILSVVILIKQRESGVWRVFEPSNPFAHRDVIITN